MGHACLPTPSTGHACATTPHGSCLGPPQVAAASLTTPTGCAFPHNFLWVRRAPPLTLAGHGLHLFPLPHRQVILAPPYSTHESCLPLYPTHRFCLAPYHSPVMPALPYPNHRSYLPLLLHPQVRTTPFTPHGLCLLPTPPMGHTCPSMPPTGLAFPPSPGKTPVPSY